MRSPIHVFGAAGCLLLAACDDRAESPQTNSLDAPTARERDSAEQEASGVSTPSSFVATMAGSDMFEIESGRLAQSNATDTELRSFGEMLVKDHQKSSADLKTAAAAALPDLALPATMPPELEAKLNALKAAKGPEFDSLFRLQQIEAHTQALATLQAQASGQPQVLADFAKKTAPVVQSHLDKLRTP